MIVVKDITPQVKAKRDETPDTVHGRLLEAVHISGYTFERACAELEWLLEDERWKRVGGSYESINDFLSTIDLSEFRIAIDQRKKLAKKLADIEASQRATAQVLGVGQATVHRDLSDSYESPSTETSNDDAAERSKSDPHESHPPFDTTPDGGKKAAEAAATKASRAMKESERQARRDENREKIKQAADPIEIGAKFSTIVIDPPWDWGDEGDQDQLGRARPDYETWSIDRLETLKVAGFADDDCHLYLWITNRSLPKGFRLLDAWGFRYVTALTWVKPHFGMGNYFRGQTEHILFGIKGSQPLLRKNQGTVFQADRGPNGHSSKPTKFYDLVESCSPGPYLEMFSRSDRVGWVTWGENS